MRLLKEAESFEDIRLATISEDIRLATISLVGKVEWEALMELARKVDLLFELRELRRKIAAKAISRQEMAEARERRCANVSESS